MPFNPVMDTKAIMLWLLLLEEQHNTSDEAKVISGLEYKPIPKYRMGFNLIPIPGDIFCNIDFAFHAAWIYVVGSIVYIAYSFFVWDQIYHNYSDDSLNPGVYTNTLGALIFIFNAIFCMFDWWTQTKQLSLSCIDLEKSGDIDLTEGVKLEPVPYKQSMLYFWNNIFFFGAACLFFIQSIWYEDAETDTENCIDRYWCTFWVNFWGNFLYFISSIFSLLEFSANQTSRKKVGLPPLHLFTWFSDDLFDWFGWGDILFFIAGLLAVSQTLLNTFVEASNQDTINGCFTLLVNFVFLIDSLAYFIGYLKFIFDVQKALVSGYLDMYTAKSIQNLFKAPLQQQQIQHEDKMTLSQQQDQFNNDDYGHNEKNTRRFNPLFSSYRAVHQSIPQEDETHIEKTSYLHETTPVEHHENSNTRRSLENANETIPQQVICSLIDRSLPQPLENYLLAHDQLAASKVVEDRDSIEFDDAEYRASRVSLHVLRAQWFEFKGRQAKM